jgi:hypothetical protein
MHLIELISSTDGTVPAYAWPGGYPIFYLCADGGVLCPVCVNVDMRSVLDAAFVDGDKQWDVVACDVNWEDDTMQCDNCNKFIQSAYGDSSESDRIVD